MMLKRWTWLAMLMVALLAFAGCSDDDDDPVTPTPEETAFEVLAEAGAAYINGGSCPDLISADSLAGELELYTVIDIRAEGTYLDGHIPGAYHSSIYSVIEDIQTFPQDKPFVVTCYSGQSAGHVAVALKLLGYDIQSLKFGMSSWSQDTNGPWANGHGDNLVGDLETTNNNGDLTVHPWPVLEDLGYEAGTALVERVRDVLYDGFKSISYTDLNDRIDDGEEFFIINYFGEADYLGTGTSGVSGHLPGAYQFTPGSSLAMDQMLENLPSDDTTIVVYCWSGQTSSQITYYLNLLGYKAVSLSYGMYGLIYSDLTSPAWHEGDPVVSQDMEEIPTPLPAYDELFDDMDAYLNNGSWYISASTLYSEMQAAAGAEEPAPYTILDIRSAEAWGNTTGNGGHIEGAINVVYTDIPDLIDDGTIPTDKPFVVVCYSGQTAGWASAYLNLMGYTSKSLLFGMAGWTYKFSDTWDSKIDNLLATPETANNNDGLELSMFPVLDDYSLEARANAVLAEGFQKMAYSVDMHNTDNFFVVNYWPEAEYLGEGTSGAPGHIPGAFNFVPGTSLTLESMLANLPTDDRQIIVYCWTGQTSSQVTMMLRMLGYDAYSLLYGSNSLFHDDLEEHVWNGNLDERPIYDAAGALVDQGVTTK